jgi:hypothetical protein
VADVYFFGFIGDSDGETYEMWAIKELLSVFWTGVVSFQHGT